MVKHPKEGIYIRRKKIASNYVRGRKEKGLSCKFGERSILKIDHSRCVEIPPLKALKDL